MNPDAFIFRESCRQGSFFITHRQGATCFETDMGFATARDLVDQLNTVLAACPHHTLEEVWNFVTCAQPA